MENKKHYGYAVYFKVQDDSKTGYSVFVKAGSEQEAIDRIQKEKLYEAEEDLDNIDSIYEITEEDIINERIQEEEIL